MAYIKIKGFLPDQDTTVPGVLPLVVNALPTDRGGYEAMAGAVKEGVNTATASVVGAASVVQLDGTTRTFMGTADELFENVSGTWTDRGGTGTYATTTVWRFNVFGDTSLAISKANTIQFSESTTFADLTGAPKAAIVEIVDRQAVALNVDDGGTDDVDRWRTSAQDDIHSWGTSISTLAATGRLVDTPGPITAGRRLGRDIAVYKDTSLYLGRFGNPNLVIDFDLVSDNVGAPSHEAVVAIEDFGHIFMGRDDFYIFNGSQIQHIGDRKLSEWFFGTRLDASNRSKVAAVHEPRFSRVIWWYPSLDNGGVLDEWVAYNYHTGQWGHGQLTITFPLRAIFDSSITYATLGDFFATYADLPNIPYDDTFWSSINTRTSYFDQSGVLYSLSGTGQDMQITLSDLGDDDRYSFISRVRPRFAKFPTSGTLVHSYGDNLGEGMTSASPSISMNNGKFDFEREARWHRSRMSFSSVSGSTTEVLGFDVDLQEAGVE